MKIRTGFVSNSSSSSFIIDGSKYSLEKIETYVQNLLYAENEMNNESYSLDDICSIYEEKSADRFNREMNEYYSYFKENHKIDHKGPVIIVDSTGDNSIPWPIQEALENIAIRRQHWG